MYSSSSERERRENGQQSSSYRGYEDRDWSFRRSNESSRDAPEDYRYRQSKREWEYRERIPSGSHIEVVSPSKRRKIDERESPAPYKRDYKPNDYSDFRSSSSGSSSTSQSAYSYSRETSQSPPPVRDKDQKGFYESNHQRKYYNDSDYNRGSSFSQRSDYNPRYQKGSGRGSYEHRGRGGPNKYDYRHPYDPGGYRIYENRYSSSNRYDRDFNGSSRYNRYGESGREYRENDFHYKSSSKDRSPGSRYSPGRYDDDKSPGDEEYDPRSPVLLDDKEKSENTPRRKSPFEVGESSDSPNDPDEGQRRRRNVDESSHQSTTSAQKAPAPPEKPEQSPVVKKRLGWGQGLLQFELSKDTASDLVLIEEAKLEEPKVQIEEAPVVTTTPPPTSASEGDNKELVQPKEESPVMGNNISRSETPVEIKDEPEEKPVEEPPKPVLPSKEEVLMSIEKVDAEISKTEMQIHNLKKPKKADHKHHRGLNVNVVELVFEENKEKIAASHDELTSLMPPSLQNANFPLYTMPQDLMVYHENKKTHEKIKAEVAKVIHQRKTQVDKKEDTLITEYKKIRDVWLKKIEKVEAIRLKREQEKKAAAQANLMAAQEAGPGRRPVITRTVRTTRGSRSTNLDVARSEAEFDEIIAQLREADSIDPNTKYTRTLAIIPPMILDKKFPQYVDVNGRVEDPVAVDRERKLTNPWTEEERNIFLKKFVQYPKNFSKIASFIENKSTADVICFYYQNKKTLDLKKILRDQQAKKKNFSRKTNIPTPSGPRELRDLGPSASSPYWSTLGTSPDLVRRGGSLRANINYADAQVSGGNRPSLLGPAAAAPVTPTAAVNPNNNAELDTRWTDAERELFLEALSLYQKDFKAIAQHLGTKNLFQCKNYYHNYKKRLGLDEIIEKSEKQKDKNKVTSTTKSKEATKPSPKIVTVTSTDKEEDKKTTSLWSLEEKNAFIKYLSVFGKNWKRIAGAIQTKTSAQVKNYFQNYRIKLNLDQLIQNVSPTTPTTPTTTTAAIEQTRKRIRKAGEKATTVGTTEKVVKKRKKEDDQSPTTVEAKAAPKSGPSPNVTEETKSPKVVAKKSATSSPSDILDDESDEDYRDEDVVDEEEEEDLLEDEEPFMLDKDGSKVTTKRARKDSLSKEKVKTTFQNVQMKKVSTPTTTTTTTTTTTSSQSDAPRAVKVTTKSTVTVTAAPASDKVKPIITPVKSTSATEPVKPAAVKPIAEKPQKVDVNDLFTLVSALDMLGQPATADQQPTVPMETEIVETSETVVEEVIKREEQADTGSQQQEVKQELALPINQPESSSEIPSGVETTDHPDIVPAVEEPKFEGSTQLPVENEIQHAEAQQNAGDIQLQQEDNQSSLMLDDRVDPIENQQEVSNQPVDQNPEQSYEEVLDQSTSKYDQPIQDQNLREEQADPMEIASPIEHQQQQEEQPGSVMVEATTTETQQNFQESVQDVVDTDKQLELLIHSQPGLVEEAISQLTENRDNDSSVLSSEQVTEDQQQQRQLEPYDIQQQLQVEDKQQGQQEQEQGDQEQQQQDQVDETSLTASFIHHPTTALSPSSSAAATAQ